MKEITFETAGNPLGLINLVNSLPNDHDHNIDSYKVVIPEGFLFDMIFPVIAAWSKRVPKEVQIKLDTTNCWESTERFINNIGLKDILEKDAETPLTFRSGSQHVPLQAIVPGQKTNDVLERIYSMVDDFAPEYRDMSPFRTLLVEMSENILAHSKTKSPGYVHAGIKQTRDGQTLCDITFADSGIGIKESYLEGNNEAVIERIKEGACPIDIATSGFNSSKPKSDSPSGKSYFGFGLYCVKRLIELNRGNAKMTVISGLDCVSINYQGQRTTPLNNSWPGTIVSLLIDLGNPLPLEDVYTAFNSAMAPIPSVTEDNTSSEKSTPTDHEPSTAEDTTEPSTAEDTTEITTAEDTTIETSNKTSSAIETLKLTEFSTKLLSRDIGLEVRAELATLLSSGASVMVDLDDIEDMTASVADEGFAKLAERLGEEKFRNKVSFIGGNQLLIRLIEFVLSARLGGKSELKEKA